jgi:hypothetical protein
MKTINYSDAAVRDIEGMKIFMERLCMEYKGVLSKTMILENRVENLERDNRILKNKIFCLEGGNGEL